MPCVPPETWQGEVQQQFGCRAHLATLAGQDVLGEHVEGHSQAERIEEREQGSRSDGLHDRGEMVLYVPLVGPEGVVRPREHLVELLKRLLVLLDVEALEVPDLTQDLGGLGCQHRRPGDAVPVLTRPGEAVEVGHTKARGRAPRLAGEHAQVAMEDPVLQDRCWALLLEELRLPRHLLYTVSGRPALPGCTW
jgi:hypothetical protein